MRHAPLLLVTTVSVLACSAAEEASSPSLEQATADAARALCERELACMPGLLKTLYTDVASCTMSRAEELMLRATAADTGLTTDDLAACARSLPGAACSVVFASALPPECGQRKGTRAVDLPCGDSSQCETAFCAKGGKFCGTCAIAPAAGQPCARQSGGAVFGSGDCPQGLLCWNGTCESPKNENAACTFDLECRLDLTCAGGRCTPAGKSGSACEPEPSDPNAYANSRCSRWVDGLTCSGGTCAPIPIVAPGQGCGFVPSKPFQACDARHYCPASMSISDPGPEKKCQPRPTEGAACDLVSRCINPFVCDGGICKKPDPRICD